VADLPAAGQTGKLRIAGQAGVIEAVANMPSQPAATPVVAVVCHPHPLYGGSLDNKVAYTLARSCAETGMVTLRFNFRGVGASEGLYSGGEGEVEDAQAVLDWALQAAGATHFVLAGFSFGGYVSVMLAGQRRPLQLVTVAPALNYVEAPAWHDPGCPWLVIQGDADDVVDCRQNLERLKDVRPEPDVHVLAGVGHFFHGRLGDLRTLVEPVLRQRLAELKAPA
jgi:alpha/beta superfamily hydrolase